jgi:type IV secretory pathway protease TraF
VFERNGLTIVKYLVGIEGDRITNEKNNIYVNAYYIGTAQKTGQLTPIKDQIISKGYLFVSGTHRYSFDSRYEEFGLIKVSDLKGRAIGLGKWDIRK